MLMQARCLSDVSASAEEAPINVEAVHSDIGGGTPAGLDGGLPIGAADGAREVVPRVRYTRPNNKKEGAAGCCVIV